VAAQAKEPAAAEPKKLRAKVVCHQDGGHFRGDPVEVDGREYRRVGRGVLLTREDEEAQKRDAAEKQAVAQSRAGVDRSSSSGWAEKEAEALRIVRARQVEEQERQRQLLAGTSA